MMHPHTEIRFIRPEIGYGVVATQYIPKGTITWAMDQLDQVFSQEEVMAMDTIYQSIMDKYSFRDNKGRHVLCWDHARFVNHSFRSNCVTTAYDFEIAIRDIEAGEELTDDYGYLNVTEPFACLPEKGVRRRVVKPDDLKRYHARWDVLLQDAFPHLTQVLQPLQEVLSPEHWQRAVRVSNGQEPMDSILSCYYKPERKNGKVPT